MTAASANRACTLTEIKAPKANWPTMEPTRPQAANTPMPEARSVVGNDSVERQSS